PAERVPIPDALLESAANLCRGRASAHRPRPGAPECVPLRRDREAARHRRAACCDCLEPKPGVTPVYRASTRTRRSCWAFVRISCNELHTSSFVTNGKL